MDNSENKKEEYKNENKLESLKKDVGGEMLKLARDVGENIEELTKKDIKEKTDNVRKEIKEKADEFYNDYIKGDKGDPGGRDYIEWQKWLQEQLRSIDEVEKKYLDRMIGELEKAKQKTTKEVQSKILSAAGVSEEGKQKEPEKPVEEMSEDEIKLVEIGSLLENNPLGFMPSPDAKILPEDHLYTRVNDKIYRTDENKTKLEQAVVKDGKLEWEEAKDEELLAGLGITVLKEEKKEEEKTPEAEEAENKNKLKDLKQKILEQEEKVSEKSTAENVDELNRLKEQHAELEKKIKETAEKKVPTKEKPSEKKIEKKLTAVEKKEIRDKVREAMKSGKPEEIKKYFEIGADGKVKFNGGNAAERYKNEMAITLGMMFPDAAQERGDYVLVNEKKAFFSNSTKEFWYENGKRAIVMNEDKVEFKKGEGKKAEEKKEIPTEPLKEEVKEEFDLQKEVDKIVKKQLNVALGKELKKQLNPLLTETNLVNRNIKITNLSNLGLNIFSSDNLNDLRSSINDTLNKELAEKIKPLKIEEFSDDDVKNRLKESINLNIDGVNIKWGGINALSFEEISKFITLKQINAVKSGIGDVIKKLDELKTKDENKDFKDNIDKRMSDLKNKILPAQTRNADVDNIACYLYDELKTKNITPENVANQMIESIKKREANKKK